MKKLFVIFLVVLVSVGLFAETKGEKLPMLNDVNPDTVIPVVTDDVGDLIWDLDVETIVADNQLLGIEYDGTYLWVTGGGNAADPNYLYKVDPVAGTLVTSYEQPAAATGWGIRDLAYAASENKIYGGNEGSFFSFDIATETWTTEFSSTFGTIRALAYDGNHFWTKSFSDPIYEFGVDGTLYNTYADANSAYGFAYDSFADCLWLFASTTTFVQFGLDGVPTGVTHAVTLPNAGVIGGAFYYEGGLVPGKTILGCLGQGTPDVAYGMELRDAAPLDAPGVPTGVTVTPDAGGALTADIDWTCPTLDVGGVTLTDLDEMRVYRDGVLIYTDTNPTIGGSGSYTDAVTASGNYTYSVVGFNDAGEGLPVVVSTWVGEDVPNVVENLLLESVGGNAYLTWVNPTTGLNGGAFNEAILGYHVERSDGTMFEVTGAVVEYTDTTVPAGEIFYTVQPYNSVGDGGIETSNTLWFGEGVTFNIFIQCDNYPGETTWDVAVDGGAVLFAGGPYTTQMEIVDVNVLLAEGDYIFTIYDSFGDGICCAYGDGYYTLTLDGTVILDGSGEFGDMAATPFSVGAPADPGTIEGTVTLDGGAGDVEDVEVTAGGVTVNPDASGDYEIEVPEGTYDVTAMLEGYEDGEETGVVVVSGAATTGVDFTLAYIPGTFDPPVNLAVDATNLFTWEAPGAGGVTEELMYDSGVSAGAYSYVGYSMGSQMSPAEPCQILELKIHTSEGTEFNAEVWGWDGAAPTEDLYYQELATAAMDDWVIVDVSGENLMMDGDFVVAFGSLNAVTYMSYDTIDNGRAWDHADAGGWATWNESYFCRAVVQYGDGTVAELSPTITPKNQFTVAGEKVAIEVISHNVDVTRELESYDVYLDGDLLGNTTDLFWQFTGLVDGQEYVAGVVAVYTDGNSDMVTVTFNANVDANNNTIGITTALTGNYPNPFNPVTKIAYSVKETGNVSLEIYNLRGQLVKTLVNNVQEAGVHTESWNGTDDSGKSVASGVYFYKMKASNYTATKKMILMK